MRLRRQDRGREGPSFLVPAWLAAASPLHSPRQGASRVPARPPHRSPSSDGRAEAVDTLYDHRSRPASCPTVRDQKDWDLSLIHISEPTRLGMISYAVFC